MTVPGRRSKNLTPDSLRRAVPEITYSLTLRPVSADDLELDSTLGVHPYGIEKRTG